MKKLSILLALLALASVFGVAQEGRDIIIRPRPRPRPPIIFIRPPNVDRSIPMKLTALKASVEVVGKVAVTTYDMTFFNGNNAILEGQFVFPLGEGQTVSRFAMDVNGRLREGVVVEKDKGRQVFDTVVRSQIDPGLLEWTKGNTFRARIYPIPAKGYKRVVIAWEQELDEAGSAGLLYRLPLAFTDTVENFSINVTVIEQELAPRTDSANELGNLTFSRWNKAFLAKYERTNYVPDKQLSFVVPRIPMAKPVVVETDASGKKYFTAMTAIEGIVTAKKAVPDRILIVQDVSASMAGRDKDREWALLRRWLRTVKPGAEIRLVQFSHAVHNEKTYRNEGDLASLRQAIDDAAFDGGTSMGAVDLSKYQADVCIFLTDGISNFGPDELKTARYPVYAIASQQTGEHAWLRQITGSTGGEYVNLARMTDDQAYDRLSGVSAHILSVTGRGIRDIHPGPGATLSSIFTFAGILEGDEGELVVRYGTAQAFKEVRIPIKASTSLTTTTNGIVRRIWAQKRIADLETRWSKNETEIIKLAKTFGIVTRGTSLIVLDRIEDYVRYRIVPPTELHAEYYNAIAELDKQKQKIEADHIEDVVRRFALMQAWYDKSYPKDTPARRDDTKKLAGESTGGERNGTAARPSVAMRDGMAEESDRVTDAHPRAERERGLDSAAKRDSSGNAGAEGAIELKKWTPDVPYLKDLEKADKDKRYAVYLGLRKQWANSSAFFLDVADFFAEQGDKATALRVLSNIAEMDLENPQLLRILGHRLAQLGWLDLSEKVFADVLAMKPEDPQSYRDLGLVLDRAGKSQRAVELLYQVATKKWDSRFPDIELIALVEMNGIISRGAKVDTSKLDRRVIRAMPSDVRVVLNWDADNCDMDLWVTDPNDEKCYYANKLTYQGGRMSMDFTRGYGPEEYLVRLAKSGKYKIEVNYYGNSQQTIAGATTVQLQLFLNWGRPNQQVKEITLRLKDNKEVIEVGTFAISGGTITPVK
ncbi:MAG TPA: VIT domain-containing protein [Spirochaetota bacterium]|nr:VIT domain-containing protein [Spirochaetota bacterium]